MKKWTKTHTFTLAPVITLAVIGAFNLLDYCTSGNFKYISGDSTWHSYRVGKTHWNLTKESFTSLDNDGTQYESFVKYDPFKGGILGTDSAYPHKDPVDGIVDEISIYPSWFNEKFNGEKRLDLTRDEHYGPYKVEFDKADVELARVRVPHLTKIEKLI